MAKRSTKQKPAAPTSTESESSAIVKSDKSQPTSSPPAKKPEPGPMTVADIHNKMFENAGVGREVLGGEAIKTTRKLLKAKKKRFFADKGVVMEEREVEDTGTQLAAARLAGEFSQAMPSRGADGRQKASVHIELVLPAWAQAKVTDKSSLVDHVDKDKE